MIESSEEEESLSSYFDLISRDIEETKDVAVEGGNQHAKEVDQVEDITAMTALHVSTKEIVVPNASPVSTTVGEKTQEDSHMAAVTPPSFAMTFQVVARDPPLLAIRAPRFPSVSQLSATTGTGRCGGGGPHGSYYQARWTRGVSAPPPRTLSLATDRADRHEGENMHKKKVKLKKRKNRE